MNNWFDYIQFHMRTRPEQPAIVMEERVVTYGMLGVGVDRCARRIAGLGIGGEAPIAIMVDNPVRHVTLCLALLRVGIASVSLERSQSGIGSLKFAAVLGDQAAKTAVNPANRFVEVGDDWFAVDPGGASLPPAFSDDRQVCHVAPTSGTTGQPKLIANTVGEVGRRIAGYNGYNWNLLLCMVGMSSLWSYIAMCTTLATGRTLCFGKTPFQALRMIELFSVDYMMVATEQLLAVTRVARKTNPQLRSLRLIEVSGSVPTASLLESAMIHVCKDIYCRYGTSEMGQMARAFARELLLHPAGYVGHVMPGIEIAIVDRNGAPCSPGEVGSIRSRLDPRWHDPSDVATGPRDGWTDLGDLGWLSAGGELYILGRASDGGAVQVQGDAQGISPVHEAEHLLRLEWDATDAGAVLIDGSADSPPEIWLGVVDCKDANAGRLEHILRGKGIDHTVKLFALQAIPRGANGKVQRAELKSVMLASSGKIHGT